MCIRDRDIYNFERLLVPESRLKVVDGRAQVPDRPGIGLAFDTDAVTAFESPVGVA